MDPDFWRERWAKNEIAFHEGKPNARLVAHLSALKLQPGARIFVPLCGKTRDIGWLLAQGFSVVGAELSDLAVTDLFADLGVTPERTDAGALVHFSAPQLDIFEGDVFALTRELLGDVDAIYDRAALVALPPEMRARYSAHLRALTNEAPHLLITYAYDETLMSGPPFCVPEDEVRRHYEGAYDVSILNRAPVEGGLRGKTPATETTWLVGRRAA